MRKEGTDSVIMIFSALSLLFHLTYGEDGPARPPLIEIGPTTKFYRETELVPLDCVASGFPTPTGAQYTWYRNGELLNLSSMENLLRPSNAFGSFVIETQAGSDAWDGSYQCRADNGHGVAVSDVAVLRRAYLIETTQNSSDVRYVSVTEGESLVIPCKRLSRDAYFPQVTFEWFLKFANTIGESLPLKLDKRISIDHNGDLYFANVVPDDSHGNLLYKCEKHNPRALAEFGDSYTNITVIPNTAGVVHAPAHLYPATERDAVLGFIGRNVTLPCIFSGNPTPQVAWTKQGGSLPPGRIDTFCQTGTELRIRYLELDDAGSYVCTGSNSGGTATYTTDLTVEALPYFASPDKRIRSINATVGDTVTMTCDATGIPDVTTSWFINNEPFPVGTVGYRTLSNDGKRLTFVDVCKNCATDQDDLVHVHCNATNVHGYVFSAGYLNVLDVTRITEGPKDTELHNITAELTFSCQATSDPSTAVEIRWTVKDKPIDAKEGEIFIDPFGGTLTIVVGNDPDRWTGYNNSNFSCIATNGFSTDTAQALFTAAWRSELAPQEQIASAGSWWLFLIILILLLIIIIILMIFGWRWLRQNQREIYEVEKRERKQGLNPEKELLDSGFHAYQDTSVKKMAFEQGDPGTNIMESDEIRDEEYDKEELDEGDHIKLVVEGLSQDFQNHENLSAMDKS